GRFSWINYSSKSFEKTAYYFEGYDIANLSLSREFSNDSTVGVGVHNLFNESYIDLYSQISRNNNWYVAGAGRSISLSYNQKF
ncbi:MAG: TonB-dependent receptor, partial [Pirellulaceae bacterium]|nr:TonB-dependent receptor [Pirellulaceae bacterium]